MVDHDHAVAARSHIELNAVGAELDGQRWYKTGDKGRQDSDGFLTIVDRYSRFAKLGGEMVSLGQVEEQVRRVLGQPELELAAGSLLVQMWTRSWLYLKKAGTVILGVSIILWVLTSYPKPPADWTPPVADGAAVTEARADWFHPGEGCEELGLERTADVAQLHHDVEGELPDIELGVDEAALEHLGFVGGNLAAAGRAYADV